MRKKILISAYACDPKSGSESAVGWTIANALADQFEVWVITRANNRPSIESIDARAQLKNGINWVYYDPPRWLTFWKRGPFGVHLFYLIWQLGAAKKAKVIVREHGIQIVQHATFVVYWMPSFMYKCAVDFIWGPVAGGDAAPRQFYMSLGVRGLAGEVFRDLVRWAASWNPWITKCQSASKLIICATNKTADRLRTPTKAIKLVIPQIYLSDDDFALIESLKISGTSDQKFIFTSAARLIPWKGIQYSLRAFAATFSDKGGCEYWIVGDGGWRKHLEDLAIRLGVSDKVKFYGWKSREETLRLIACSQAFVFPSLHDSGGFALLEAMALAKPVICLDIGGPGMNVTKDCGIKIPLKNPEQVARDLSEAMLNLWAHPHIRERLSKSAAEHVRLRHSMRALRDHLNFAYSKLIGL